MLQNGTSHVKTGGAHGTLHPISSHRSKISLNLLLKQQVILLLC